MALGLGSLDGRSSDRLALGRGNGEWEGCAGGGDGVPVSGSRVGNDGDVDLGWVGFGFAPVSRVELDGVDRSGVGTLLDRGATGISVGVPVRALEGGAVHPRGEEVGALLELPGPLLRPPASPVGAAERDAEDVDRAVKELVPLPREPRADAVGEAFCRERAFRRS